MVKAIPRGYSTLTPYLIVHEGANAIEFYTKVFGARPRGDVYQSSDGKIGHAELMIGDSLFMLADEYPEVGAFSPKTIGGSPVNLTLYVEDADLTINKAADAGAAITRPIQNQFYGDRSGQIRDPFGHIWTIATHIEDVSPEEMQRRAKETHNK